MWRRFFVVFASFATCAVAQTDPSWWSNTLRSGDSHALENNYAPANLGQLKNFADQARLHLNGQLDGGSGTAIETMVAGWTGSLDGNYSPINLGQLKFVADKFYSRLDEVGFDYKTQLQGNGYNGAWTSVAGGHQRPWNESAAPETNYAPANLGQLKILFSFNVAATSIDSDGNYLPDIWEMQYFGNTGIDPSGDNDNDGLSNVAEHELGTNPTLEDYDNDGILDGNDSDPTISNPVLNGYIQITYPEIDGNFYENRGRSNNSNSSQDTSSADFTKVKLQWPAATNGVDHYDIERDVDSTGWISIASVPSSTELVYEDENLKANVSYVYKITAIKIVNGKAIRSNSMQIAYQVPLNLHIHWKISQIARDKIGIHEYTSSAVPKYYLREESSSSSIYDVKWSGTMSSGGTWTTSLYTDWEYTKVHEFDPKMHSEHTYQTNNQTVHNHYGIGNPTSWSTSDWTLTSSLDEFFQNFNRHNLTAINHNKWLYERDGEDASAGSSTQVKHSDLDEDYFFRTTYIPATSGTARWTGESYDPALGTTVIDGSSNATVNSNFEYNGRTFLSAMGIADSAGVWNGVLIKTVNGVTTTSQLNNPYYTGGWNWLSPGVVGLGTLVFATSTKQQWNETLDSGATNRVSSKELISESEYTTSDFISDALDDLPDYPSTWNERYIPIGANLSAVQWDWTSYVMPERANRNLSQSEENFGFSKFQYKFTVSPTAVSPTGPKTLEWYEVFVPTSGDISDIEASQHAQIITKRSWPITANNTTSGEYEIDPATIDAPSGKNGRYSILGPIDITARSQYQGLDSDEGLVVEKGESITVAIAPQYLYLESQFKNLITWQYRQLKGDGTYTSWTAFGEDYKGKKFEYATPTGGIFQVKAIVAGDSEEHLLVREHDDAYGVDSEGSLNPTYKKGQPDYFGVTDSQWQIDVRNSARTYLGSTAFARAANLPVYPGGPSTINMPKCNIFVYKSCTAAGVFVPTTILGGWPPTAKQWWTLNYSLPGWDNLGQALDPQPGEVVSRPAYSVVIQGTEYVLGGHVGILDYDGAWISAGPKTVNRYAHLTPPGGAYQPARVRIRNN